MEVEKFPDLIYQRKHLIWDSRQTPQVQELVFVPESHIEPAVKLALLSRKNAEFVRETGHASAGQTEVADARWELGRLAALATGEASKKIKVLAVTGTNGKTTTASLLRHVLVDLGKDVVELGTLGCRLYRAQQGQEPVEIIDLGFTTPLAPQLHDLVAQAVQDNYEYLVMEASSQGIALGRMAGLHVSGAFYLNLTQDHLDFHGDMEHYGQEKLRLFSELLNNSAHPNKFAVFNRDQELGKKIPTVLNSDIRSLPIDAASDYQVESLETAGQRIHLKDKSVISSPLMGAHNAQNIMTGYTGLVALGFDPQKIRISLATFGGAKGRLERVSKVGDACQVFVDYAHTPDALEKILSNVKSAAPSAYIVCVFGCGGDRDKKKRPLMGEIAGRFSDHVFLTADNSRSELTTHIIEDILLGFAPEHREKVSILEDRRVAIQEAIRLGKNKNAVVIIAGKGHEDYQILQNGRFDFSDQKVAQEYL